MKTLLCRRDIKSAHTFISFTLPKKNMYICALKITCINHDYERGRRYRKPVLCQGGVAATANLEFQNPLLINFAHTLALTD